VFYDSFRHNPLTRPFRKPLAAVPLTVLMALQEALLRGAARVTNRAPDLLLAAV
jgi:hypothetical protein